MAIDPEIRKKIQESQAKDNSGSGLDPDSLGFFQDIISAIFGAVQAAAAAGEPFSTAVGYGAWENAPIKLPDAGTLTTARFRRVLNSDQFREAMRSLGFDERWSTVIEKTAENVIDINNLYLLLWRGEISQNGFTDRLQDIGYNSDDANKLFELSKIIPPLQDVIQFAVKDVFDPEAVRIGDLFADLPTELLEIGHKQGLSDEFLKFYWGAHWRLPSVQMGFEMLHRDVIESDILKSLMKSQDIAPGWRQPLMDISFRPLTRVDVRRMHAMGALSTDQVTKAYKDLGYDEENAQLLTDFTVLLTESSGKNIADELTGLTKSNILSFFRRGMLDSDSASTMLESMGVGSAAASALIENEQIKLDLKKRDQIVDDIIRDTKTGEIDFTEAQRRFEGLGATDLEELEFNNKLERAVLSRDKLPSVDQIKAMLKSGYLSDDESIQTMERLGYSEFWARGILGLRRK